MRQAVQDGITRSAGVVTGAAVVMIGAFAIFGTLNAVEFKQLGIGLAVAIFLDAVAIRIFVLPALMSVIGMWNWWPGGPAVGSRGRHSASGRGAGKDVDGPSAERRPPFAPLPVPAPETTRSDHSQQQ
ncbi:MMPL family transporter [Streptomyces sp. NPDC003860]